ncbi:MAG: porin family protein [Bacteroidia bacterium]
MKKILTITAFALAGHFAVAQDDAKNFRFGLVIDPSVNWYKPDGKILSGNGAGVKFGGGLVMEFRLAKVASFQTGLRITGDGGKIKYNNGDIQNPNSNVINYFYNNADDVISKYQAPDTATAFYTAASTKGKTQYQLNSRQYKATYVTVPLVLKLKTKEIGTLTYFGQFGVNASFRWKATADDQVTEIKQSFSSSTVVSLGASDTKSKVDVTKDVSFFKAALTFGFGAEMNLSGTTSLTFGLNYNLGFTNSLKSTSDYLARRTNDADYSSSGQTKVTTTQLPQSVKASSVVLTVGVLF